MNKRRASKTTSMRSKLLIVAVVIVGLSSIAYAAFSQTLTINGTGTATGAWNVSVTDITLSDSVGATQNSTPSYNATSATFDVGLAYPGAYAEYVVTVTNGGSIPAILESMTDLTSKNSEAPSYITYTVSGVTPESTLLGTDVGEDNTNVITVRVEWLEETSPDTEENTSKSATINFNYVQNT